jgi:hypothetical protein
MAKLYREVILKEKPIEAGFVPVDHLTGNFGIAPAKAADKREEVGTVGD